MFVLSTDMYLVHSYVDCAWDMSIDPFRMMYTDAFGLEDKMALDGWAALLTDT